MWPVYTLAAARLQLWAIVLSAYGYDLEFTPRINNQEADMLSRLPLPVEAIDPNEITYHINYLDTLPVTADQVKQATAKDPILSRVLKYTLEGCPTNGSPELHSYAKRSTELSITEGCLIYGGKVVIPYSLQKQVLSKLHTGHIAMVRMKATARSFVWWPALDRDVESIVRSCSTCQEQRNKPAISTPTHPWIYPEGPWKRVRTDFVEYGGRHYLLLVDAFSKWPEVHELHKNTTACQTVECMRRTFATRGIPYCMVTDNGPQFLSEECSKFMRSNGIHHQRTPPYHPSTNGQVERMIQELKKSLKSKPSERTWSHQVSLFLLHYQTTPHGTTGKTPAELLMKRSLRTRLSLLKPEAGKKTRDHQREEFNQATTNVREMGPGDIVSVWNPRRNGRSKWLAGRVTQRLGPTSYLVNVDGHVRYVHIDHLITRDATNTQMILPEEPDILPATVVPDSSGPLLEDPTLPPSTLTPTETTGEEHVMRKSTETKDPVTDNGATEPQKEISQRRYPT